MDTDSSKQSSIELIPLNSPWNLFSIKKPDKKQPILVFRNKENPLLAFQVTQYWQGDEEDYSLWLELQKPGENQHIQWYSFEERMPGDKQPVLMYRPKANPILAYQATRYWKGDEDEYTHWAELIRPVTSISFCNSKSTTVNILDMAEPEEILNFLSAATYSSFSTKQEETILKILRELPSGSNLLDFVNDYYNRLSESIGISKEELESIQSIITALEAFLSWEN